MQFLNSPNGYKEYFEVASIFSPSSSIDRALDSHACDLSSIPCECQIFYIIENKGKLELWISQAVQRKLYIFFANGRQKNFWLHW